jgi:histidinol-phosphate aminotransferase
LDERWEAMSFSRRHFLGKLAIGSVSSAAYSYSGWSFGSTSPAEDQGPDRPILLDQNENPNGPFESVRAEIQTHPGPLNRYPGRAADQLVHSIAKAHGLAAEQIILGCGSTDILRAAAEAFLGPGKRLLTAVPTFPDVVGYAGRQHSEVVEVALNRHFEFDLASMQSHLDSACRLVYICTPNSSTGTVTPRNSVQTFLENLPAHTFAVLDEAYHHFVEPSDIYASFIDRPINNPRVIVTRTFSKIFGLAGLRVGYAVCSREVAAMLRKRVTLHAVNVVATRAAEAAMADTAAINTAIRTNTDNRQEFYNEATGRRLKPLPSHTNFATFDTTVAAEQVIKHFQKHGIMIYGPLPKLDRFVRVSIGTSVEMLEFWRVWDLLGIHPQGHH